MVSLYKMHRINVGAINNNNNNKKNRLTLYEIVTVASSTVLCLMLLPLRTDRFFKRPVTFPAILVVGSPSLAVFRLFNLSLLGFLWLIGRSHLNVNLRGGAVSLFLMGIRT